MVKKWVLSLFLVLISLTLLSNEISEKYHQGVQYFDKGEYKKSIKIFKKILKKYPRASDLGRVQAKIGEAYEKMGKYKKAFKAYEEIFAKYQDYDDMETIVKKEFEIAEKYAKGEMKSIFGLDFAEANKTALMIYDRVIKNFPFGEHAETSFLRSVDILIETKKYEDAEKKIRLFKQTYEKSKFRDHMSYKDALIAYLQIKKADYDQTATDKGISRFSEYLKSYPEGEFKEDASEKLKELKELASEQKYKTALFYMKSGKNEAANRYFKDIIDNFPNTSFAVSAQQYYPAK